MKNLLLTLSVVLAACALSFGVSYAMNDEPAVRQVARQGDALAWLRAEFHLNDAQFSAIKKLHDDYDLVCADHCAAIMAARQRPARPAELAALEAKCVESMEDHFHRVAALMPPREGERYLATVLPRIADYDHATAPTVQVHP